METLGALAWSEPGPVLLLCRESFRISLLAISGVLSGSESFGEENRSSRQAHNEKDRRTADVPVDDAPDGEQEPADSDAASEGVDERTGNGIVALGSFCIA